ncbi:MAG: endonuclease/exonuclease/phosphatase family protein [Pirellulaceae bacterium]
MRVERSGLLIVTGLAICAVSLVGMAGRCWWVFDLCSHFRVQYLLVLSLLLILFLRGKHFRTAAVCGFCAAINVGYVLPYYVPPDPTPHRSSTVLRAISINVNTANRQVDLVKQLLHDYEPDVVLLMEVNAAWMTALEEIRPQYPYQKAVPRDDNFGIALYSKLPFTACDTVEWGQAGVPSLVGTVEVAGQRLTIVGTHPLPPINHQYAAFRNGQLEAVAEYLATVTGPKILLGDLNTSPWSYYFGRLLKMTTLRDSSRGLGIAPTWPTNQIWLRIPIDFCLVSQEIIIVDKHVGADIGSDHFPLIVDFSLDEE